jgi:hypothetical protein
MVIQIRLIALNEHINARFGARRTWPFGPNVPGLKWLKARALLRVNPIVAKIIVRRFDGRMLLSRRDRLIVARHEVPGCIS